MQCKEARLMARKVKAHKANPHSKYWRELYDKEWSWHVKYNDKFRCIICGSTKRRLNSHHLIRKDNIFFRHNLNNGVCLCTQCHLHSTKLSAHGTPWAFEDWMKEHRKEQWEWWDKNRWEVPKVKINYKEGYEYLRELRLQLVPELNE